MLGSVLYSDIYTPYIFNFDPDQGKILVGSSCLICLDVFFVLIVLLIVLMLVIVQCSALT
jgi:hypothetical protein